MSRKMVPGLRHRSPNLDDDVFFAQIDEAGGWPVGYEYVGFEHSAARDAGFCNSPHNDGWWTVVASADDYYLWKLSPAALQRVVNAAVESIRLPRVDPQRMYIRNSRGYRACIAKAKANA